MGMLDGKVAVVTGAGRGIGRGIAEGMAREGARVVVNDLGTTESGEGTDAQVAVRVAEEIVGNGGEALGNSDSVASWEGAHRMVQAALDRFGRIDILVNNAGILRDRMAHNLSQEDWDQVLEVHLKGAFCCTRAATPHMKKQKWGRIVHMVSTSGLLGSVGQTNDAAAKMAVAGFSRNVAIEMAAHRVTSNCVAPFAMTRLIRTVPTETDEQKHQVSMLAKLSPADVAPLVVFLASEGAEAVSGQIFGVRGREIYLFSQPRIVRSTHRSDGWTVEGLSRTVPSVFRPHMVPLKTTDSYFSWDPMV